MQVRFLTKVCIPGGPLYAPGEVVNTDQYFLPESRAEEYRRRGWVEIVEQTGDRVMDASTKAPAAPPAHKAILSRERTTAKQQQ